MRLEADANHGLRGLGGLHGDADFRIRAILGISAVRGKGKFFFAPSHFLTYRGCSSYVRGDPFAVMIAGSTLTGAMIPGGGLMSKQPYARDALVAALGVVVLLGSTSVRAASPSFTLNPPSATLPGVPASAADILAPAAPPAPGPLAPPVLGVPAAALGLVPGDVITGIHFSTPPPAPGPGVQVLFSVDAASAGAPFPPPPANLSCEAPAQAKGDVFLSQPFGPVLAYPNVLQLDGNGLADSACGAGGAPGLGLMEPSTDDVKALEMCSPRSVFSGGVLIASVAFTLAPGSPTLAAISPVVAPGYAPRSAGASDILFASPPGFAPPKVLLFAEYSVLSPCASGVGAPACDEIDAVSFLPPPPGGALFSLAPGSPSLAACGFTAADLIYSGAPACLLGISAAALGLSATDNIDAVAVITDADSDLVADTCDNCPAIANNDQADRDGDGLGDICDTVFDCLPAAAAGCDAAGKSLLSIKDRGMDGAGGGDKLAWKWLNGPAVPPSTFGAPATTADYAFCVYTGTSALALEAKIPAGAGWSPIGTKGYKYLDATLGADGVQKIVLKGSATPGRSKILIKGRDGNLDLHASTLPLDDSAGIVVQLQNSETGHCWEATFPPASVIRNRETLFKAKTP